ncbi:MAG TPA: S41 family peptidase [Thermodesulfobacteriota bacterium]
MRTSLVPILLAVLLTAWPLPQPPGGAHAAAAPASEASPWADDFDAVWRITGERFFDPDMRGVDWNAARARYAERAAAAPDLATFAEVVNEMLGELRSSHTRLYTDRDPEYYFLRAVFRDAFRTPPPEWDDAGLVTVTTPQGTFVRDLLDGGPAAKAGLRVGDRLLGHFHPVETFEGRSGRPVTLAVQSEPGGPSRRVDVFPRRVGAQRAYLEATQASIRRIPLPGGRGEAGYIRLWALTHPRFLQVLEDALAGFDGTAGLVLDLRGGFGGRSEDYLDLFMRSGTGRIETVDRRGRRRPFFVGWDRPIVVLVDGGTRSAKELLAWSLARAGRARLVGTRTAGAVLASRAFPIGRNALLLVAVTDLLADGVRLEGRGIEPHVVVEAPLPYRGGADPQLDRALDELAAMAAPREGG